MINEPDPEMLRLQIIADVYRKLDAFVEKINTDGCGLGKLLNQRLIDFVDMEYENFKNDLLSKYGSVQAAQRILFDDILPKIRIHMADIAGKLAACAQMVEQANKANKEMIDLSNQTNKESIDESIKTIEKIIKNFIGPIVVSFIILILTSAIGAGAKLYQDWINQKQTASFLEQLAKGVKVVEVKNGKITVKGGE